MKHVITAMNISIGLTQSEPVRGLKRDHFIMKLINLLIREHNNCSLVDNFLVTHHAEICQFDHLSL